MENTTINGYKLKYQLGEGGMAAIWYAENYLQKPAAVKVLQQRFCQMPEVVHRFENEARLMVQLNHPHIRNVYDYSTVDGCPCMIMEYLEGKDLSHRMKEGEWFTAQQLTGWWNSLVDALQYTHRKNIIHRDIKPSNLFLTEEGQIKILDFGIAKLRDNVTVTQTGSRMGTLMYMSPEQVYDVKNLSYKTDSYSLAVTFYHLVSGKPPYDASKISDFEIQENIVRNHLDTSSLPEPWRSLLPLYLAKNPEDRKELRRIDAGMPIADETILFTPVSSKEPVGNIDSSVAAPPLQRTGSNHLGYIFLVFFIVAALVLFALNKDRFMAMLDTHKTAAKQPNKEKTVTKPRPKKNELPPPPAPADTVEARSDTVTSTQVVTSEDLGKLENDIKIRINDYYRTRQDCGSLSRFFRDTVDQYYNKSSEPLTSIQKECAQYHGKWRFTDADIASSSYVFTHNPNGNTYVDFNMLYKIKQKEEDDWIPYNIDVSIVFDKELKIVRIVERRIEKL
ncbi:serine/threonine protein kinase [Niabella ginsenosidivorans]|uniref:non-specific serine/threonine protein kinase n=1 Tax=Niabella ginsenosidivorans TaxID=1176587 RepID=A0A1A9I0B9_9BACT|nr:serine/threonine-protein kinase [Niabella ginsenosidivorans]ANH81066.1 serine/threonine protein kinase [Niabella ginsenosidivorans]